MAARRGDHPRCERRTSSEKVLRAEQLVRNVVHEDGGPLIHNGWEDEQHSFDTTCRKFHRLVGGLSGGITSSALGAPGSPLAKRRNADRALPDQI